MKLLLTPREAAAALSLSERTLWTLTQAGDVPSLKIGRSVRYDVNELRAWIARKQENSENAVASTAGNGILA